MTIPKAEKQSLQKRLEPLYGRMAELLSIDDDGCPWNSSPRKSADPHRRISCPVHVFPKSTTISSRRPTSHCPWAFDAPWSHTRSRESWQEVLRLLSVSKRQTKSCNSVGDVGPAGHACAQFWWSRWLFKRIRWWL